MTSLRLTIPRAAVQTVGTAVVLLALAAALWIGAGSLSALRAEYDGPVYTVAQLHDDLVREPRRLVGQTLRVRGVLQSSVGWPCAFTGGPCVYAEIRLTGSGEVVPGIPVVLEPEKPLSTWLRRLPWVGAIVPPAQALQWDAQATYRVRVRRVPGSPVGFAVVIPDTTS